MKRLYAGTSQELDDLIRYLQKEYADSFQQDDLSGMIERCGELSIAYSAAGCNRLADKWMDEYLSNLDRVDPTIRDRIESIRELLPNP